MLAATVGRKKALRILMVDRFRGCNVKSPSREIPGRAFYV
jgi:hypothetical protein